MSPIPATRHPSQTRTTPADNAPPPRTVRKTRSRQPDPAGAGAGPKPPRTPRVPPRPPDPDPPKARPRPPPPRPRRPADTRTTGTGAKAKGRRGTRGARPNQPGGALSSRLHFVRDRPGSGLEGPWLNLRPTTRHPGGERATAPVLAGAFLASQPSPGGAGRSPRRTVARCPDARAGTRRPPAAPGPAFTIGPVTAVEFGPDRARWSDVWPDPEAVPCRVCLRPVAAERNADRGERVPTECGVLRGFLNAEAHQLDPGTDRSPPRTARPAGPSMRSSRFSPHRTRTRQTAKANTPARALRYAPASRSTPSALAARAPRQPARPQAASPKSPCSNQRRRHPATAPCDGPIHRATSARVGPPAIPRWPARASGPRRRGLTRSDGAASAPDLLGRDFSAEEVDRKWVGDFKQVGHRPRVRCFSRPSRTPPPGRQHWPSPPGAATWPVVFWTLYAAPSLFIRITAH